jgi:hypothetical protein
LIYTDDKAGFDNLSSKKKNARTLSAAVGDVDVQAHSEKI